MPINLDEAAVENLLLAWFESLGYAVAYGPDIAPGEFSAERDDYSQVVLQRRLRDAVARLNPKLPTTAQDEALRRVLTVRAPSLSVRNRAFHRLLVDGVPVQYQQRDGRTVGGRAVLVDWDDPARNDWLVVNQFTVEERPRPGEPPARRRPDVVVLLNGLPIAVIELKNPLDENATVWTAYNHLQTYIAEIPSLFVPNELLVVSDGLEARVGSLTADREWFLPWHAIEGEELASPALPQLRVIVRGLFQQHRLLDYLRYCIVVEEDAHGNLAKKIAGYHQFHAVQAAVEATVAASSLEGDRRAGVVWHTQGAGKSLTMAFYAGRIVQHPAMRNPTVVVITDRNDLDDQLYDTFCRCRDLLRQEPVQAESRTHLRQLLQVASGGVVFTTVQKFFPDVRGDSYPLLSERHNIVVIADEAHRSQYDFIDGYARHMRDALPNASFIGFTGTPIELDDRNTRAVFGDYVSIYDIQRAVEDGATVPIYYESRLAKLELDEGERPHLDEDFEEITEDQELTERERLKTKWAALEALVGTEERLASIAEDIVCHYERRLEAMAGKAMIVCMSRRICVDLYAAIVKLRPQWQGERDEEGLTKIVMSGSASDPVEWQPHIRSKHRREDLANRFRDPDDAFKIVIVRDMWLTGFDAPCLHTMYVDKPMRGHGLMQAISRVNRVFRDKPGGLVVDYIGLAPNLQRALQTYTRSGGKGTTAIDQQKAVEVMLEKYEICCGIMHGFDWSTWQESAEALLKLLPAAQEHILAQEDGRDRWLSAVSDLSKAFALAVPNHRALAIRDDLAFFQHVRAALAKPTLREQKAAEEIEFAVRQLVSRAVASDEVIDIFSAAGLKKPDISILSEKFLEQMRAMPHRNLAAELLRRLLSDEIKQRQRTNVVQARSFAEMLQRSINAYKNHAIETVAFIEELIALAKDLREADRRGEHLGLSVEELAFYDALAANGSAVRVLGDETLRAIALELVETVRRNVTIDWTLRENVRARLRVRIKRVLRKRGYPPDKQEAATRTVLEQAEVLCADWAA